MNPFTRLVGGFVPATPSAMRVAIFAAMSEPSKQKGGVSEAHVHKAASPSVDGHPTTKHANKGGRNG